jgi:hypothetical protein
MTNRSVATYLVNESDGRLRRRSFFLPAPSKSRSAVEGFQQVLSCFLKHLSPHSWHFTAPCKDAFVITRTIATMIDLFRT